MKTFLSFINLFACSRASSQDLGNAIVPFDSKMLFMRFFFSFLFLTGLYGCVEPIEIETNNYEDALVIEGIITSELQQQEILLSRTYRLEEDGPSKESNAQVVVMTEGENFQFTELEPGRYVSTEAFRAIPGRAYTLKVTTSNGKTYASEPEVLSEAPELSDVSAVRTTYRNKEGVAILLDVDGNEKNPGYYLYNFEETYKIVSPFDFPRDLVYRDGEFVQVPKTREEEVCYVTELSREVLLANTNAENSRGIDDLLVRFIEGEDYRTAHRYSIRVRQFSISGDAFSYYETLKDFSDSESLFSQNQLGLINGNLFSESDPDEKVIGFFSIADVSSQRIFFDFEDFYSTKEFIPDSHVSLCEVKVPDSSTDAEIQALRQQLESGSVKFIGMDVLKYRFVRSHCVDCTLYGTNAVPDFWIE
ncbi:DUF4249 domain-containing protein [Salinimicrobium xinjiangense]|uniref:DUF4249 domain-containing protein n=1 Tax=Salinimicrobium xinjiangense TaxID=438596 RepID=UPI00048FFDC0|nr:DUF4249 domain-containing protein [Salinimicrobium xinjiangense]